MSFILEEWHPLKIETFIFSVVRLIEGEVFLVWDGGEKMKSQKDLAKGVKLKFKDDMKVLDYYRWIELVNMLYYNVLAK